MKKYCFILLGLFVLALSACNKDDCTRDVSNPISEKMQMLTKDPGRLTALKADPPIDVPFGPSISNLYAEMAPCQQDDLVTFENNGSTTKRDAGVKCPNSADEVASWTFKANETKIQFGDLLLEIIELTESKMRLKAVQAADPVAGTPETNLYFTYIH